MRPRRDRWLSMAEVAHVMGLKSPNPRVRRLRVSRLLRRLERRDGTTYTRRFGPGNGKLYVSVSALEQLMPWDPGTLTAIRGDVGELGTRTKRLERRVAGHDRDLAKLADWQRRSMELLSEMSGFGVSKGIKKESPKSQSPIGGDAAPRVRLPEGI